MAGNGQCDNVRASYDEIPKAVQDEVYARAKAFASENKGSYEYGGYIYSGEGQDIGQFWVKLAVGNVTLTQITEDGDLAVWYGSNQYYVSDKVIRGGVKIQKRDLETSDTKGQGSTTLKDAEFEIISLKIDAGNSTSYLKEIEDNAKLTEKHLQIIRQRTQKNLSRSE